MSPLPPITGSIDQGAKELHIAYQSLCGCFTCDAIYNFGDTNFVTILRRLSFLRMALFFPRNPSEVPDSVASEQNIGISREILRNINGFINQFDPHIRSIVNDLFKDICDRLRDFCMSFNVIKSIGSQDANEKGHIGKKPTQVIDGAFDKTIQAYIGKIFVVDTKHNLIISESSGMLFPSDNSGSLVYDKVITCAHNFVFEKNASSDLEFYFVRSPALDVTTGLPHVNDIIAVNSTPDVPVDPKSVDVSHLITYLRCAANIGSSIESTQAAGPRGQYVRRIERFSSLYANVGSVVCEQAPRYRNHEDIGFAYLERPFMRTKGGPFLKIKLADKKADILIQNREYTPNQ